MQEFLYVLFSDLQIDVNFDGKPIPGSPFTSKAFDAKCAKLSCIEEAVVGRPSTFMIDAARAGAGNMEIIVSVENRNVPNFVQVRILFPISAASPD